MNKNSITIEYLQENFDSVLSLVENGESFIVTSEHGEVALIPYHSPNEDQFDEFVKIHTEHEDGC